MTTATPPRPTILPLQAQGIPPELAGRRQWTGYRLEWNAKGGRWEKVPVDPLTGRRAKTNDPRTWGSIADAIAGLERFRCDGVGFVLNEDDPFAGLDLDDCRDPETGEIAPWALAIVDRFPHAYVEPSTKRTGLRVFFRTDWFPTAGCKPRGAHGIENYWRTRFLTVSGNPLPGRETIGDGTDDYRAWHTETFPPPPPASPKPRPSGDMLEPRADDDAVLNRALAARNGAKMRDLFNGSTAGHGGDHSGADLALVSGFCFWTADDDQVDRLFRRSGLARPKWDRDDYRARTIALARRDQPGPQPMPPAPPPA